MLYLKVFVAVGAAMSIQDCRELTISLKSRERTSKERADGVCPEMTSDLHSAGRHVEEWVESEESYDVGML